MIKLYIQTLQTRLIPSLIEDYYLNENRTI